MSSIYVPKRYEGFNIVTLRQLKNRPDAIADPEGSKEAGKIIELNPAHNTPPVRQPSGKFDSYTADTPYHILIDIPPITQEIEADDGKTEYKTFYTKVAARIKLRWVSTNGREWDRLYFFR